MVVSHNQELVMSAKMDSETDPILSELDSQSLRSEDASMPRDQPPPSPKTGIRYSRAVMAVYPLQNATSKGHIKKQEKHLLYDTEIKAKTTTGFHVFQTQCKDIKNEKAEL